MEEVAVDVNKCDRIAQAPRRPEDVAETSHEIVT